MGPCPWSSPSSLSWRGTSRRAACVDPMLPLRTELIAGTVDPSELHIQDNAGLSRYAIAAGVIESAIHLTID